VSSSSDHCNQSSFRIRFTAAAPELDQDEESFEFEHEGRRRRLRVHDYADIYEVPGLYEALVYETLQCNSPPRVAELLASVLADWPDAPADLRVMDLGAGNGIMAEELGRIGVNHIVGLDLLPEAAAAARRDRPDVYEDYVVTDLTALGETDRRRLERARLGCLVTVAALGFGDIPPEAFAAAFNLIAEEGWLAMTIKEDFLDASDDDSGFARLLRSLIDDGIVEIQAHQRYCHRLSIEGEQLFYLAIVARKTRDIPAAYATRGDRSAAATTSNRNSDPASLLLDR
jgi:trans-aconitate methyltransferase